MEDVPIPATDVTLYGDIAIPDAAQGVVVFAHGSGSGRHSPRNRFVAAHLRDAGLATVLADLLSAEEERADAVTGVHRFDIGLLARRVLGLVDWVADYQPLTGLGIGLFGASTGAAAALVTAAIRPGIVRAIVSRGGRPDLAGDYLRSVRQPTLLIVGGRDEVVIDLNRAAEHTLAGEARLEIVPGATHLFAEPDALEQVARLAADWFTRYLPTRERAAANQ
jgi:pimeloyl-ACP methyl ester carboxylesterase